VEPALLVADQVDAGHVDAHPVGRVDAGRRPQEVRAGGDDAPRHHAVGEHLARAVHVGQERLERPDALCHADLDRPPLRGRDDPGHDVQREGPFDAFERERDALIEERPGQHLGAYAQLSAGQGLERSVQRLVALAGHAELAEHLVPAGAEAVLLEKIRHALNLRSAHCVRVTPETRWETRSARVAGTGPADDPARDTENGGPGVSDDFTVRRARSGREKICSCNLEEIS
jgi:hypothetical protein